MKKRGFFVSVRRSGILRWSTTCLLAGGMAGISGCERKYTATAEDEKMARIQSKIDELDARKSKLMNGEVENNFNLPGVGYYHAEARDFFEFPYGHQKDGRWYANGKWQDQAVVEAAYIAASRPTPAALARVEAALELEQKQQASQGGGSGTTVNHHHGSGLGTGLMMYWLLAGNRGHYNPGPGFQRAGTQVDGWQRGVDSQRNAVSAHAAANPGYNRLVQQSRSSGTPVKAGSSVRGGFGSSGRSSSSS